MNTKGQMSFVFFVIVGVLVAGFLLYQFYPTLNQVRSTALQNTDQSNVLVVFILYSLMPLIVIAYLVLSVFAVIWAISGAGGQL